jgi:hypothetical protein
LHLHTCVYYWSVIKRRIGPHLLLHLQIFGRNVQFEINEINVFLVKKCEIIAIWCDLLNRYKCI